MRSFPVKQLRTACISVLNGALFLANSQEIVGFDLRSRELWTVYHFQSNAFSSTSLANGIEFCFALTPNEFGIFAGLKNQSLIMTAQDKLIFDKVWILNTLNTSISCRVCKPDPIHGYPTNRQCYAAQCLTDKLCLVSGFTRSSDSDPLTKHYDIWTFTYSNLQWHRCFTHSPVCSINAMINVSTMGSVFISGGLVINKSALASRFSSVIEVPVIVPTLQSLANRTIEKHKEAGSCKPRNLFIKLRKT